MSVICRKPHGKKTFFERDMGSQRVKILIFFIFFDFKGKMGPDDVIFLQKIVRTKLRQINAPSFVENRTEKNPFLNEIWSHKECLVANETLTG